jgi:hypothetical protein
MRLVQRLHGFFASASIGMLIPRPCPVGSVDFFFSSISCDAELAVVVLAGVELSHAVPVIIVAFK